MKVICSKCGHVIDRDKIVEGQIVEEYKNVYGTKCPKCGTLNKPLMEPSMVREKKAMMGFLREQMRDKIRRK